jgi:regulator of protease activity HflC (stomatin/prohibitin superfamily)
MVSNAIAGGNVNALNYFVANNYVEALKEMAKSPNQKMLLLPIEATGVLGSLAGIAELAKESLSQQQAGASTRMPPPTPR